MTQPEAEAPAASRDRSRLRSLAMIAVFDIGGPLLAYNWLRSQGLSEVIALVLSGVFPAFGVAINFVRHRRLDAIGALVLAGIIVGTVLGLVSGNPRLVLLEGSVPTAVFGVLCLASLWSSRPLIYRFALEFMGSDSPQGREFGSLWLKFDGFRRMFKVMTIVWGLAYIVEAAARVFIVETTSAGTALAVSKVMPYVVAGLLVVYTIAHGRWMRRRGERLAAQAEQAEQAAQAAQAEQAGAAAPALPPGSPGAD